MVYATNNDDAASAGAFQNRFQFDGVYINPPQDVAGLAANTVTIPSSITLGTNIPFGTHTYGVEVDYLDAVTESNEDDNDYSDMVTIPPPNPSLTLSATPSLVRKNDTSTLEWDTVATYPMSCTVIGGGVSVGPFDPSNPVEGPTGSIDTAPITAEMKYTLSCTEPVTGATFTDTATVETTGEMQEI